MIGQPSSWYSSMAKADLARHRRRIDVVGGNVKAWPRKRARRRRSRRVGSTRSPISFLGASVRTSAGTGWPRTRGMLAALMPR